MARGRVSDTYWYDKYYYKDPTKRIHQWYTFLIEELIPLCIQNPHILEIGCGESYALEYLYTQQLIPPQQIYGIDQSKKAIERLMKKVPRGQFISGDLYDLPYKKRMFHIMLMMEVIEHVEDPVAALTELYRVGKPGSVLFLSFPNFSVLPWRMIRFISDTCSLPQLINRQPIDNIYSIAEVLNFAKAAGFTFERLIGVTYLTAALEKIESWNGYSLTHRLNSFGFGKYSLHPLLVFRKK